jgi:tetraacyldisaccharide 4'-kinase
LLWLDEAAFLRLIRGQTRGPLASVARVGLSAASVLYGLGVAFRNTGYDRSWQSIAHAAIPIISIGNITLGGTGKTPMVEYVARWGRERGLRVAILSRGYGGSEGLNDEGRVLDENLPDVPHLQDRDRATLARVAVEELESELLVLDDGFQHRRLSRDLDIVLLDALDPFGLGRIFPRGLLREPIGSLRRAGVVVLSRGDLVSKTDLQAIRSRAERAAGPLAWAVARHAPLGLKVAGGADEQLTAIGDRPVAAFCGIGNPEGFRRTLEGLGARVVGFRAFPDHHAYSAGDVADLIAWARGLGAELALTTQKDSVKLRAASLGPVPLRALRIGLEVMEGENTLRDALARVAPVPVD